jgi:hypothetical protein
MSTSERTAHLTLSDGAASPTTVDIILCDRAGNPDPNGIQQIATPASPIKFTQGSAGYSDSEPPFVTDIQEDFRGGRGNELFSKDKSKYHDSWNVDASHGYLILSPKATLTTGYEGGSSATPTVNDWANLIATTTTTQYVYNLTMSATTIVKKFSYWLKQKGTCKSFKMRTHVYAESTGPAGSPLISSSWKTVNGLSTKRGAQIDFPLDGSYSLTDTTKYWFGVEIEIGKQCQIGLTNDATAAIQQNTGSGWSSLVASHALSCKYWTISKGRKIPFLYQGAEYLATSSDDFTAGKLYRNGYAGVCASNAANKTLANIDASPAVANNFFSTPSEYINIPCIIEIIEGPGSREEQPWRTIIGNTGNALVCDHAWNITHTAATKYVIHNMNTWYEITLTGVTVNYPFVDVQVVDKFVYLSQGYDGGNVIRMQWDPGAATYTFNEETFKADTLCMIPDEGKLYLYCNVDGNTIKRDAIPGTFIDMSLGASMKCGSSHDPITNIIPYGNPLIAYVLKQGGFGSISGSAKRWAESPISEEMRIQSDYNNGKAACRVGQFLVFSMGRGVQKYFNNLLTPIGPDRGEGLPKNKKGYPRKFLAAGGVIFCAIDAGDEGYSTVMKYLVDYDAWHEIFRAPWGCRILDLGFSKVPGVDNPDLLWISAEEYMYKIPYDIDPLKCSNMTYESVGHLDTSWIYGDMITIKKYADELTLFTKYLSAGHQWIEISYQLDGADDDDPWIDLVEDDGTTVVPFNVSPWQKEVFFSNKAKDGIEMYRIRFRIELNTDDEKITPKVEAWLLKELLSTPVKAGWKIEFVMADAQLNLQGKQGTSRVYEVQNQLNSWANSDTRAKPLLLTGYDDLFNSKYVKIEPNSYRPIYAVVGPAHEIKVISSMVLLEV